jgi:deoxyinosine 3'endonuclease (endonuclease V)
VDISFDKNDPNRACAYLTVLDYNSFDIVYENHKVITLTVPYISGFLGFREVPHYIDLLDDLTKTHPQYQPDVILVDGYGTLHPRGFGSASHLGVLSDIPTIGCAKTLMCLDGMDEKYIKNKFKDPLVNSVELKGISNIIHGMALRSLGTTNPIYVSVGHKISLDTACLIVKKMCKFRVPEPIRISDIRSKIPLVKA